MALTGNELKKIIIREAGVETFEDIETYAPTDYYGNITLTYKKPTGEMTGPENNIPEYTQKSVVVRLTRDYFDAGFAVLLADSPTWTTVDDVRNSFFIALENLVKPE